MGVLDEYKKYRREDLTSINNAEDLKKHKLNKPNNPDDPNSPDKFWFFKAGNDILGVEKLQKYLPEGSEVEDGSNELPLAEYRLTEDLALERILTDISYQQLPETWSREKWKRVVDEVTVKPDSILNIKEVAYFVGHKYEIGDNAIKRLEECLIAAIGKGVIVRSSDGVPLNDLIKKWYEMYVRADELDEWFASQKMSYRLLASKTIQDIEASPNIQADATNKSEWTLERLEELYNFHQNEKIKKKNKSFKKATANHYGITTTRVAQLLAKYEKIKSNNNKYSQLIQKTSRG